MTDRHLDTSAGVLRFCELRRREMAEQFMQDGRFEVNGYSFTGYVFATHDIRAPKNPERSMLDEWRTGPKLDHVQAMPLRLPEFIGQVMPPRQVTRVWAEMIRAYTKITRAMGTLIMTEMWHVHTVGDGRPFREQRDDLPEDLADADNRQEALMMMLEHSATGAKTWASLIKRNPTRLEPWEAPPITAVSGRLVNLSNYQS